MYVVQLIKLFLTLASSLVQYAHDKKLMDAGAAKAVLASVEQANEEIARANAARANANSVPVSDDPDNRNK